MVGITGTNGKSTVTTLVARMAARAGVRARVGGNLGEPALDLLMAAQADAQPTELYVLELSSYQLEATYSLDLRAATVLNVTPDHLDRYASMADYAAAKARIFARCDTAIINLDDPLVAAMPHKAARVIGFSLGGAPGADYTLEACAGGNPGWSGAANRCSRCPPCASPACTTRRMRSRRWRWARRSACRWQRCSMSYAVFPACRTVRSGSPMWTGCSYVDDSKGTNVGATLAAVAGMPGPLIVIAGGDGKSQDFAPLREAFRGKVRHVVLIGRDAPAIAQALDNVCPIQRSSSMPEAVRAAAKVARPGDTVLLSPACASLDMFRNYAHRGEVFSSAVRELAA